MSERNGGLGGCLTTIRIVLVFAAAFGLIEWETVGKYARFLVALVVAVVLVIGFFLLWSYFSSKN